MLRAISKAASRHVDALDFASRAVLSAHPGPIYVCERFGQGKKTLFLAYSWFRFEHPNTFLAPQLLQDAQATNLRFTIVYPLNTLAYATYRHLRSLRGSKVMSSNGGILAYKRSASNVVGERII